MKIKKKNRAGKWGVLVGLLLAFACFAQDANVAVRTLVETIGSTTYVGKASATRSGGSPSVSNAVWSITKIEESETGVEVTHAFNTNAVGDQLFQNVWTNRLNATYK